MHLAEPYSLEFSEGMGHGKCVVVADEGGSCVGRELICFWKNGMRMGVDISR